ncbi:MAG: hypothetical protein LBR31_03860 [Desulfovibrio sp.]|jgi:hypothetical protein|nr:hypothetical protein [Desulfovibrio sp.]
MSFAALVPSWLDAFLIAPFRWPESAYAGMWLGSGILAFYCLALGECVVASLYLLHHRYYAQDAAEMTRCHRISMNALHSGDREAYLAANMLAREHFGKNFFSGASLGLSSLWPLPFALGWMALRFEGIDLYALPVWNCKAGYVFVLLSQYMALRLCFGRVRKFLPLFGRVDTLRKQAVKVVPDPDSD